MEKDPQKKAAMRHDMDGMNIDYLDPLIQAVRTFVTQDNQVAV